MILKALNKGNAAFNIHAESFRNKYDSVGIKLRKMRFRSSTRCYSHTKFATAKGDSENFRQGFLDIIE